MSRVAALLFAAVMLAAPHQAAAVDDHELTTLLGFASHFSGRPMPPEGQRPATTALPAALLAQTVCPDNLDRCRKVVAAYDAKERRIVHLSTLDIHDPIARSFLVHELVHYLQHLKQGDAFLTAGCKAALDSEREAYRTQDKYLAHVGKRRRAGQALLFTHCEDGDALSRAAQD